jgi:hypothetical protein
MDAAGAHRHKTMMMMRNRVLYVQKFRKLAACLRLKPESRGPGRESMQRLWSMAVVGACRPLLFAGRPAGRFGAHLRT